MNAITFDTHKYVKLLQSKGFTEQQAEEVVSMTTEIIEARNVQLATKADLKNDLYELKIDIVKYMFTGFIAVIGLLVAVLFKH